MTDPLSPRYFDALDDLLQQAGQDRPCLVLDLDRYQRNIALARSRAGDGVALRVVAKSLGCLPLLDRAVEGLGAIGVMTFSARMLEELLRARPGLEHLMGKPLPVRAAGHVLQAAPEAADQVIWLIDSAARADQYAELAVARGVTLRVALEVDVGLHRGGVALDQMGAVMAGIAAQPGLRFEGVMGYEPHLAKLPALLRNGARARVERGLAQAAEMARAKGGTLVNTGGSMTFSAYGTDHGITEVSLGSVLVKPTDFDLPSTEGFEPALFIATPILKYLPHNPLPGLDPLRWLTRMLRPAHLAIYGGYWKAQPVHPPGFGPSSVFGHSSNQEVWSGWQVDRDLVDRFAFLRPTQSEAVLPEFGEVIVVADGQVRDRWDCLPVAQ